MQIRLNKKAKIISDGLSLQDFIALEQLPLDGIALAINMKVIPRDKWASTFIQENDELTLIQATKGG